MNAAGTFDADDKAYVAQVVSGHTGLSPEEASKRVDTVIAQAREAAEEARKYGIVIAFLYAASMLVSALAAWWSQRSEAVTAAGKPTTATYSRRGLNLRSMETQMIIPRFHSLVKGRN